MNITFTPTAFDKLFNAYYNSLVLLKKLQYHSISFPLISAGIFGGRLENPVAESVKQCCLAYKKFREENPEYYILLRLCAYSKREMELAQEEFARYF